MSWYSPTKGTRTYTKRAAITVDTTGGGGSVDVSFTVPTDWDDFWGSILANGYDIVITEADGITLCTFDRNGYTYASRALTLEVDNVTLTANQVSLLWVYYGYSGEVTDRITAFAPAAAKSAYIELFRPAPAMHFVYQPDRWAASRPAAVITKKTTETVDIAVSGWPMRRRSKETLYNGSDTYEEVKSVNVSVYAGAVDTTTAYDETKTRIVYQNGEYVVYARLTAGADGTDYTVRIAVTTTLGQVLEWRGWLTVRDTDEA